MSILKSVYVKLPNWRADTETFTKNVGFVWCHEQSDYIRLMSGRKHNPE